jgi:hypothetical protein
MRQVGDKYVITEFRLHRAATEIQTKQFLSEWTTYLRQIKRQKNSFGIEMSDEARKSLNEDQWKKLNELL